MLIAVDFDGTIVTHEYPKIGEEIPFAIDVLKKLQNEEHHRLVLWTVRTGTLLDEAVQYCRERGLEFYAVNKNYPEEKINMETPRKLNADMFIDDRNVGGLPDWGKLYKKIKGEDDTEEADSYQKKSNKSYASVRPKNIFIRFGEWIEHISSEIDKRK